MNNQIVNINDEFFLKYSEYFKKKKIVIPHEFKNICQIVSQDRKIAEQFLENIKNYIGVDLEFNLEREKIEKADYILLNIVVELFPQVFTGKESIEEKLKWIHNTMYTRYLTVFYYTYVMGTTDVFCELLEQSHYSNSKLLSLYSNLKLLSSDVVESFGHDDYLKFMDMFLEETYLKKLYCANSYKYLKPVYDMNSEAFKNPSMFVVLQHEEIIRIFGLNTLSFMSQEELNFLVKQTDIQELNFIKQLYDFGKSFDQIKKVNNYPQLLKTVYCNYLDRNEKRMKQKEMR